jgi:hypothetical protein
LSTTHAIKSMYIPFLFRAPCMQDFYVIRSLFILIVFKATNILFSFFISMQIFIENINALQN